MIRIYPTIKCRFEDYLVIFELSGGDHRGIHFDKVKCDLIRKYALEFLRGMVMCEIQTAHIDHMQKALLRRGVTKNVLSRLRTALSQMFELAWDDGIVYENPCAEAKRYRIPRTFPVMYNDSQNGSILRAVEMQPNSGIFKAMIMAGISLPCATELSYDKVDFDRHILIATNRIGMEYEVTMSDLLEQEILHELRVQEHCRRTRNQLWSNPDRRIFTDGFGGEVKKRSIVKQYDSLRRLSGVPGLCMRTMRSNYLMSSVMYGQDLPMAAREAGFVRPGTMLRYYEEVKRCRDS